MEILRHLLDIWGEQRTQRQRKYTGLVTPSLPHPPIPISSSPNDIGCQRACDTVKGRVSCILPNTAAKTAESHEDIFGLFFDSDIMNIIAKNTSLRIQGNIILSLLNIILVNQINILGSKLRI